MLRTGCSRTQRLQEFDGESGSGPRAPCPPAGTPASSSAIITDSPAAGGGGEGNTGAACREDGREEKGLRKTCGLSGARSGPPQPESDVEVLPQCPWM